MLVKIEQNWHMAHRLMYHKGDCKNIHGHTYKVVVVVGGEVHRNGIVMDFSDFKKKVKEVISALDHALVINKDDLPLRSAIDKLSQQVEGGLKYRIFDGEVTAENLAKYIYDNLALTDLKGIQYVEVYETATNSAIYTGSDDYDI